MKIKTVELIFDDFQKVKKLYVYSNTLENILPFKNGKMGHNKILVEDFGYTVFYHDLREVFK